MISPTLTNRTRCLFHRAEGITLVELLLVIGTIAVMLGLLFPVFKQVRQSQSLTICTKNLRTLAQAHLLYTQDRQGVFTSARWDNPSTDSHNPGFRDYLGLSGTETASTVMTCPAIQNDRFPSKRPMQMNYGLNTTATHNYHINSRGSTRKITRPGKYLLFSESVVNPALGSQQKEPYNYFTTVSWAQKPSKQFIHQGRQNVLFLDGHVELLTPDDFPEGKKAYTELIWWGSEY